MAGEQSDYSSDELPLSQETFQHVWEDIRTSRESGLYNQILGAPLEMSPENAENGSVLINEQGSTSENIITYVSPSNWVVNTSNKVPQTLSNLLEIDVQSICESNDQYQPSTQTLEANTSLEANHQNFTTLPASCNWKGDYGFDIMFDSQEAPAKGIAWTYSEVKDKLYVMKSVPCPIQFVTSSIPAEGTIIRAMAVFINPEHVHECVKRCLNHSRSPDPCNIDHPAPDHLIRCESPYATHITDSITGRHSVIVPYERPLAGAECTSYIYKYMCWGSCVGGLNRRRVKVIFTLEKNGQCLGRRTIEVRICACPGRDRRSDEKELNTRKELPQHQSVPYGESTSTIKEMTCMLSTLSKKRKMEDNEEFILKVRNRKHYELLKKIRDNMELADSLTPDLLVLINKHRSKSKKPRSSEEESE